MARTSIEVKCPCCAATLEVDVVNERVVNHHRAAPKADDPDPLTAAMRHVDARRDAAASQFDAARGSIDKEKERLDQMFDQARRRAGKPDDAP